MDTHTVCDEKVRNPRITKRYIERAEIQLRVLRNDQIEFQNTFTDLAIKCFLFHVQLVVKLLQREW